MLVTAYIKADTMIQITKHTYISPDGIVYEGYGIAGTTVEIKDISTDRAAVQRFVELCNRLGVSEEFLQESVEDFLASETGDHDKHDK